MKGTQPNIGVQSSFESVKQTASTLHQTTDASLRADRNRKETSKEGSATSSGSSNKEAQISPTQYPGKTK